MAITYSFEIVNLTTVDTDDHTKVVGKVQFRYKGVDENNISYAVENFIDLDTSNINSFIEFADLTEENVVQWLTDNVHEDAISDWQNLIDIHIARTIAERSQTVQTTLPWENT